MMTLILASKSPRRQQLMRQLGLQFTVRVTDTDETMDKSLPPQEEVARVSAAKAAAVACDPEDVVVAADTIVVVDETILGKPADADAAVGMLRLLSGLDFRPLSDAEIRTYVATGDPLDKAGSYGVQGMAGSFVERIKGDYFNVMGLPICTLTRVLRQFGVEVIGEKG